MTLRDGSVYKGRILRYEDPHYVWLEGAEGTGAVRRSDVAEVSHPGQGEMITAAALAGVSVLSFYAAATCEERVERPMYGCASGPGLLGFGFGLTTLLLGNPPNAGLAFITVRSAPAGEHSDAALARVCSALPTDDLTLGVRG